MGVASEVWQQGVLRSMYEDVRSLYDPGEVEGDDVMSGSRVHVACRHPQDSGGRETFDQDERTVMGGSRVV